MNPEKERMMEAVLSEIASCDRCGLCHTCTNHVPGEGDLDSPVVFIGEAPGRREDQLGRPFVGSAGKLLDGLLGHVGLGREEVYITNVVKCRPPGNRRPSSKEIRACTPHLREQLGIIKPQVLAAMGNSATGYLLKSYGLEGGSIGEVHGKSFAVKAPWGGVTIFPLYHPAAALYNRGLEEEMREDFGALKRLLAGGAANRGG